MTHLRAYAHLMPSSRERTRKCCGCRLRGRIRSRSLRQEGEMSDEESTEYYTLLAGARAEWRQEPEPGEHATPSP
ncbi:hypothetical protein GCM10010345_75680 [Streptomyces canarius]|uniref:Uncharacterized protein n=1 Tax=Streptomyces canarius TaxID=285453 RepID=A0ABQ3D743_9ACTN|nr:hypothetical protein GCM10010345_75680 [Streptomyces canarius]